MLLAPPLLAFAAFGGSLSHDLVWDDNLLLGHVRALRDEGGWSRLLTAEFRLSEEVDLGYYRPVVLLSLALDDLASGDSFATFHLTNVLLHVAVTWLVGCLLCRFGLPRAISAFGAALFAVHPVHVESVAFVSGRTDVLAALFVLIATMAWATARASRARARHAWSAVGGAAFALALLSKEAALALPLVLLVLDVLPFPGRRKGERGWWERNASWLLCWVGAILLVAVLRVMVADVGFGGLGRAAEVRDLSSAVWSPALLPGILATYARLLVVPWPLNGYYTPDQISVGWLAILSIALIVAAVVGGSRSPTPRAGLAGVFWIVAFLLPVSGIVPIAGSMVAERFLYAPSIGFSLVVCAAASTTVASGRGRRVRIAGATGLVLVLAALTVSRVRIWADDLTLYSSLVEASPNCVECLENLGIALHERGRHEQAVERLRRAIGLRPSAAKAHDLLGIQYGTLGRPLDALPHFVEAIKLRPDRVIYRENLGKTLLDLHRFEDAERVFREAILLEPGQARLHLGRGLALVGLGRVAEAERERHILASRAPDLARRLAVALESP